MNDSPNSRQPAWVSAALVAVLTAQVGLLWLHGGMLNRQHGEIQSMRQDIQDLTDAIDDSFDAQGDSAQPGSYRLASAHSRWHARRPAHLQRTSHVKVVLQDAQDSAPEGQDPTMKEIKEARDSSKKAVADARDIRQKLSIEENARKAEEKKKVEEAKGSILPFVYGAMALGVIAFLAGRMWRARAGGR